jgi:hypothetical protein
MAYAVSETREFRQNKIHFTQTIMAVSPIEGMKQQNKK